MSFISFLKGVFWLSTFPIMKIFEIWWKNYIFKRIIITKSYFQNDVEETLNPVADIKYKCAMQEQLKTVHDTRISVAFSYSVNCIYINYLIQNLENFQVPIYICNNHW